MTNLITFAELPLETQENIKALMACFSTVYVSQNEETAEYTISSTVGIASSDTKEQLIAEFHKDELIAKEAQMINYMIEFADYPSKYKGKRNYKVLNEWKAAGRKAESVKIENGEFKFN